VFSAARGWDLENGGVSWVIDCEGKSLWELRKLIGQGRVSKTVMVMMKLGRRVPHVFRCDTCYDVCRMLRSWPMVS